MVRGCISDPTHTKGEHTMKGDTRQHGPLLCDRPKTARQCQLESHMAYAYACDIDCAGLNLERRVQAFEELADFCTEDEWRMMPEWIRTECQLASVRKISKSHAATEARTSTRTEP